MKHDLGQFDADSGSIFDAYLQCCRADLAQRHKKMGKLPGNANLQINTALFTQPRPTPDTTNYGPRATSMKAGVTKKRAY